MLGFFFGSVHTYHGASCPWGEMSVGWNVRGANCPWGEMFVRRNVCGASCRGASYPGESCLGASGPGTGHTVYSGAGVWSTVAVLGLATNQGRRQPPQYGAHCQADTQTCHTPLFLEQSRNWNWPENRLIEEDDINFHSRRLGQSHF
jgi:hypothetical protein